AVEAKHAFRANILLQQARLMSIAGSSTVDMVYVPTLTMGSKSYGGLISPVLLEKNIGAEGMLGLDSLQDQRIVFDFARNELNVEDASKARKNSSRREIVVTAKRLSGQLIFTEASISGVRVNVIVDTGAQVSIANSTLKNRLIKRAKESGDEEMLIAVTGDMLGVEFSRARDFRIGRARFASLDIAFADAPPFERFGMGDKPALLLGMDVLRRFDRVAIDFAERKIHFLPPRSAGVRVERNKHTNTRIKN
ncbi:MAG: retropepsin-like aspartic protease, partial [Pseudomonadota bacterium]